MESLADRLRTAILRDGPMPFSQWMRACLYDPAGYYMRPGRKTGTGADADFATPPTLHPFFGQAMAMELRDAWERSGRRRTYTVVEVGGGEGDLARAALAWADAHDVAFAQALRWHHQEISPEHRRAQGAVPDSRMDWDAPQAPDACLLVEVLDAQPFDVHRPGEKLHAAWDRGFVEAWLPSDLEVEGLVAVAAGPTLTELADAPTLLICDYGGRGRGFRPQPRAFRRHEHVPLVGEPGEYDITMDVDFAATRAQAAPLVEAAYESLEAFLLRHGILDELNAIDRTTPEGASSYLRLRQLLLPTGLGAAFKVQRFEPGAKPGT